MIKISYKKFIVLHLSIERIRSSEFAGDGGNGMWFGSAKQLFLLKDNHNFKRILSSLSCLSIIAESSIPEEISSLVDFTSSLKVKNKYLAIKTVELDTTLLQSKRLNFNVLFTEIGKGKKT